jgi:hypothetical protein
MYSYPNLIPLSPDAVQHIAHCIADLEFADVYGFTWRRNIIGGGKQAVEHSIARYLAAVSLRSDLVGQGPAQPTCHYQHYAGEYGGYRSQVIPA